MFEREEIGNVVLLRMCHGKANALDLEFLEEISRVFEELAASDAGAVVITGTGGIFSAGVDLKRLAAGGVEYTRDFIPALTDAFEKMFFFPRPLVAACNGHAIAGGAVMLCTADVRYAARGKGRIGVPELLVGVPFPLIALQIMKFAVRADRLQEVVYTGENHDVESAVVMGLCEKLFEADELVEKACARAQELAEIPSESFRFSKEAMRVEVKELLSLRAEAMDAEVTQLWCSDEQREAVEKYLKKTLGA
ncbi:MAG: enoyl-CoA hydratase/isomerase family protein [Deltaproteobacteria bacterium]|nr:enoyl-CoA hydratase/isomerase family protein [Deltaproteobacteria bacterium]